MAAGDLTTLADVKAWSGAGAGGVAADPVLQRLITAASAAIVRYTGRNNLAAVVSYPEIRNGNGKQEMALNDRPVTAITSLTIDQQVIPAQLTDGQPGYFLIPDSDVLGSYVLALERYTYCRGRRNVRVTYSAGFATPPTELAQACIEWVSSMAKRGQRDPLQDSVTAAGQQTAHFRADQIPTGIRMVLDAYRKVVAL